MKLVSYLKARLKEQSSWASIVAALTAASLLDWPWDVAAAVAGIVGVLVPEQGSAE